MLLRRREVWLSQGVGRRTVELHTPDWTLQLVEAEGCSFDTDALPRAPGTVPVNVLTVALRGGCAHGPSRGLRVRRGRASVHRCAPWDEAWFGPRAALLTLQWRGPGDVVQADFALSESDVAASEALAEALRDGAADVVPRLRHWVPRMRASGVDIPPLDAPEVPAAAVWLQRHLDGALCSLHTQPQWVDLERATGQSARHLRRLWEAHADWLGPSLRERLLRTRQVFAASLLAARGVGAAEVARSLGYGSTRALRTAFRRSGGDGAVQPGSEG